ncbi:NAD(P)-dependent oxidoreductase [Amycolatopsis sp. NPDC051102]|uniref:NAD(P)-dependent oxidoreductase n=1 Tax=Amycolatopsis sp. NPDC051102 TaxID=3155163 RepID=UPI00343AEF81
MTEIGFVGLGAMGAPLARRLLSGNQVTGTNRTRAKAAGLIDAGLGWRDTPREVAAASQVVFSMVTDDDALAAITRGPDGILAGLRPGTTYVEMSTVSPRASRRLAARVRAVGATMIDAPVAGSVPAAETGALTIMVGGPEKAFLTAAPLLSQLGNRITHVGENGQGLLLKLAINISLAAQMLAFSEGLLLAERGGIDPALAVRVMTGSAIGSPMLQARAPLALHLPEHAWFDVELMHKDIHLALDAAQAAQIPLPAASAAEHMLSLAGEMGYEHRDIAGLYQVLAAASGEPHAA